MKILDLIKLKYILDKEHKKENLREFGLRTKGSNFFKLKKWIDTFNIEVFDKFSFYIEKINKILILLAFIFGLIVGFSLLKFGFGEYVNIIYFLFFGAILPLIFSIINLIYILKKVNISILPSLIIEKTIYFFYKDKSKIKIDNQALYYYNIKSAALISLFFSIGLLVSLILVGVARDIPFGWSSTLNINSNEFYRFIKILSFPFSFLELPTKEVIEQSRYFAETSNIIIDQKSIHNIWWKFLIYSTLFYGVIFRLIVYLIANLKYKIVLKKRFVEIGRDIIENFNQPLVKFESSKDKNFIDKLDKNIDLLNSNCKFEYILAWNYQEDEILKALKRFNINSKNLYLVGGLKSFFEDLEIIKELKSKEVSLFVKSWDVPTLDFIDFLEELSMSSKEVGILFDNLNISSINSKDIWIQKIETTNLDNIKICKVEK